MRNRIDLVLSFVGLAVAAAFLTPGIGAQPAASRHETVAGPRSVPPAELTPWPSPAAAGSLAPQLAVSPDGRVYLSWLEPAASGIMRFRLAERTADSWNQLPDIADGTGLFANWADVPSVFAAGNGTLVAHWLQRTGTGTYAYGIRMRASADRGRTWSATVSPHRDESPTEHGFLSFFDAPDGAIGMVWLDGRETAAASSAGGGHGHGGGGAMTLRATTFGSGLTLGPDVLVDGRVCDCCPTAAIRTGRGAIIAYRDRSDREVRDIGIARLEGGAWKPGGVIHADDWTIAGCPVNGPALAAAGDTVALAWFTAAGDQGRAHLALSRDGGASFGAPVRVDDGGSMGRVDVEVLPDGSAVVVWIEFANAKAELRMRRVWPDGRRGPSVVVSGVTADRSSGNPRLVRNGHDLVLAWRASGPTPQIHVAAAKVPPGGGVSREAGPYSIPSISPRSFARPVERLFRMNDSRPMKSTCTSPKG